MLFPGVLPALFRNVLGSSRRFQIEIKLPNEFEVDQDFAKELRGDTDGAEELPRDAWRRLAVDFRVCKAEWSLYDQLSNCLTVVEAHALQTTATLRNKGYCLSVSLEDLAVRDKVCVALKVRCICWDQEFFFVPRLPYPREGGWRAFFKMVGASF